MNNEQKTEIKKLIDEAERLVSKTKHRFLVYAHSDDLPAVRGAINKTLDGLAQLEDIAESS